MIDRAGCSPCPQPPARSSLADHAWVLSGVSWLAELKITAPARKWPGRILFSCILVSSFGLAAAVGLASEPIKSEGETVLETQAAFMHALRDGPQMRKRIFDTLQQRHSGDFGDATMGTALYETLLSAVRESHVPGAAEEFEERFGPLLQPNQPRDETGFGGSMRLTGEDRLTAVEDQADGSWRWITLLYVGAAAVGALVLGLDLFNTKLNEPPILTGAPISTATIPERESERTTEPAAAILPKQQPASDDE